VLVKSRDYDYEYIYDKTVLGEEEREEKIQELKNQKAKLKIRAKTIQSGEILESEIYPVWIKPKDNPKVDKSKLSPDAMSRYNDKQAQKHFVRVVHCNFFKDDLYMTLTFDKLLGEEAVKKAVSKYLAKIRRYRKKNGMPPLVYVYVIEYVDEENIPTSKRVRMHVHLIMNRMDRNVAEEYWENGRSQAQRLQPDEFGFEGVARYMLKGKRARKNKKRWYGSRNLKLPVIHTSDTKLTKKKAEKIARTPDDCKELFEKLYNQKYRLLDVKVMYSDITAGYYIRARMRKRD